MTTIVFYTVSLPRGIESMDQHLLHLDNTHDSRELIPECTQMPTVAHQAGGEFEMPMSLGQIP